MATLDFNVEAIDAVVLEANTALAERDLMSPYVWELDKGRFGLLVRAVPRVPSEATDTGTIWFGTSQDGLKATSKNSGFPIGPESDSRIVRCRGI